MSGVAGRAPGGDAQLPSGSQPARTDLSSEGRDTAAPFLSP